MKAETTGQLDLNMHLRVSLFSPTLRIFMKCVLIFFGETPGCFSLTSPEAHFKCGSILHYYRNDVVKMFVCFGFVHWDQMLKQNVVGLL